MSMDREQETYVSRRAFIRGLAALIPLATLPTAAATDTSAWWTPEMWEWAVNGTLSLYERYDVIFIPQPDGRIFRSVFIGEGTTYDHEAVTSLDEKMKAYPELWDAVLTRVRELQR